MPQTATVPVRDYTPRAKPETALDRNMRLYDCPFDHTPNAETIKAFEEGDAIRAGGKYKRYNSVEEFLADLDADD